MAWAISRKRVISCATEHAGGQALERFLLAHDADAARNALTAGFVAKKTGDAQQDVAKINCVIKQHDDAGA